MASNGFRPALLFLSSSGVSTTASMWRESSPTARDDQWLRADRPSPTRLPSAYRHRKIPAAPSSPLRIKISRIRFAQVGSSSYFSRCPEDDIRPLLRPSIRSLPEEKDRHGDVCKKSHHLGHATAVHVSLPM